MALILSIDEPVCFHVFEFEHRYYDRGNQTAILADFPISKQFEEWVYKKISVRHAMRYPDRESAIRNKFESFTVRLQLMQARYSNVMTSQPLTFSAAVPRAELPDLLMNHYFDRIRSDIDTLVLSDDESISLILLEGVKMALDYLGFVAMVAFPGTGTLLAVACAFLGGVVPGAGSVAAALLQARIADRPEEIDDYTRQAIVGATFSALCAMPDLKQFGSLAVKQMFTPERVGQALAIYRAVKVQIGQKHGVPINPRGQATSRLPGHRHPTAPANSERVPPPVKPQGSVADESLVPVGDVVPDGAQAPAPGTLLSAPGAAGAAGPGGASCASTATPFRPLAHRTRRATASDVCRVPCPVAIQYHYMDSPDFRSLDLTPVPGRERVGYRTLSPTDYVQIYTMPLPGQPTRSSTMLVVSAHGGYREIDLALPGIPLPPRMILDMLCPHDASLLDPTIDRSSMILVLKYICPSTNAWKRCTSFPRITPNGSSAAITILIP